MTEEDKQRIRDLFKGSGTGQSQAEEWIATIEREDEGKTRCEYPLSDFYTYQEDVPPNVRVSGTSDCESCKEDCEDKHCLITENKGEETEKEKKCESRCPCCGSYDIHWGLLESVSDEWHHQRGTCLDCDKCFTEVSELVYKMTLLTGE